MGKRAVFLAADRRLTRANDGALVDDMRNKCVIYDSRIAFGFTGRAEIERKPTSEWLAGELAKEGSSDLGKVIPRIALRLTDFIRTVGSPDPMQRAVEIVGVGWSNLLGHGLTRTYLRISNIGAQAVDKEFRVFIQPAWSHQNPTTLLRVSGQPLGPIARKTLVRSLRHRSKHGESAALVTRDLVNAIRSTSDQNPTVGRKILTVVVPRPVPTLKGSPRKYWRGVAVGSLAAAEMPSMLYWEDGHWNGITYGADVAGPGVAVTNVVAGPIPPNLGGLVSSETGFRVTYPIALLRRPDGSILNVTKGGRSWLLAFSDNLLVERFIRDRAKDASVVVVVSPAQLDQVLLNLVNPVVGVLFDMDSKTLSPREQVNVVDRAISRHTPSAGL